MADGKLVMDYSDADGTDAAHPAWWRGYDHGVASTMQIINRILDGGRDGGTFGYRPLEELANRIGALRSPLVSVEEPDNSTPRFPVELAGTRLAEISEELGRAKAERDRLHALLNTPELEDFAKAIPLEAAHQRERWGTDHDAGKEPEDWFWVVGYLAGKALRSHSDGNVEKAKHHTITCAAVLANWHARIASEQL